MVARSATVVFDGQALGGDTLKLQPGTNVLTGEREFRSRFGEPTSLEAENHRGKAMHQYVETLVLPGGIDMWSFDPMIEGGEVSLGTTDPIQRLVYYACSPRTHCIVNYSIQKASKSCHMIVYGPVADFAGEPAHPGNDVEPEQRIYVRACVRRTAVNLLDYEVQRRFAAVLLEKTDCIKAPPKKYVSEMTARNLRHLLKLPAPAAEVEA